MSNTILVTGGIGYIGSHTVYELYNLGYNVIIIDNLINSSHISLENLKKLIKTDFNKEIKYYNIDLCDKHKIIEFAQNINFDNIKISGIIHFAALKNVGESTIHPFDYYDNNIKSLLNIVFLAKEINCYNFIFSSSCTVYPHGSKMPLKEVSSDMKPLAMANNTTKFSTIVTGPNPYGNTKIICEQILHDISKADTKWNITILRYFNPAGYHSCGLLGEVIVNYTTQQNLFMTILSSKKYNKTVNVFGSDYNTPDGTAIRDYIHVIDLANSHIKALEWAKNKCGLSVFNIGLGKAYSVKDILNGFIKNGFNIDYILTDRREGDSEMVYADNSKALNILGWKPKLNLEDMIKSSIDYYNKNA